MNILLLAGGESSEREVSLESSASIYEALIDLGHGVKVLDPFTGETLAYDGNELGKSVTAPSRDSVPAIAPSFITALYDKSLNNIDLVFLGLHGGCGEDGTIQRLLELADLPFTGSRATASAVAMDKAVSKRLMSTVEVQTPGFRLLSGNVPNEVHSEILDSFTLPVIVKPNDGGSTVGLTKVHTAHELPAAIELAFTECETVLIEEFVPGREVTVAVVDGRPFPVVEIVPHNELYDYDAKYTEGKSTYIAPAELSPKLAAGIQRAALRVYDVIGASGLARIDFILSEDGRCLCLELNTLPGMTELSLSPMAAKAEGIDFSALLELIISSALGEATRSA